MCNGNTKPRLSSRCEPQIRNPKYNRYLICFIKIMAAFMTLLFPAVNRLFGRKGIKALQFIMYQMGADRAPILKEALNIDVNDARSLGRILDFDDGLCDVKGVWRMETKGKAIKVVSTCPLGRILSRCPEICRTIIAAMEAGTFYPLNPDVKVPEIPRLISEGGDCCVGTIELPYLDEHTAFEISPQGTGSSNYAPAIHIPGLNKKLAYQALKSLCTAFVRFLRYGTKQEMAWYDFFKYERTP